MKKEINWLLQDKYNGKLPKDKLSQKNFKKDIRRLEKGEPLDYVIGFREFLGCKIDLSKRPLIPREETEFWVGFAIDSVKNSKIKNPKCLDIFSGSGCIGIAVLANALNSLCDFADKDKKALSQIKINLKNNFIKKSRYNVISSDVFKKIKRKYDFIFANPPYIAFSKKSKIQKSVLKYEPKTALFAKKNGIYLIENFLKNVSLHLNSGGAVFMEFDSIQKNKIKKMIKKYGFNKFEIKKDQYNRDRWIEFYKN